MYIVFQAIVMFHHHDDDRHLLLCQHRYHHHYQHHRHKHHITHETEWGRLLARMRRNRRGPVKLKKFFTASWINSGGAFPSAIEKKLFRFLDFKGRGLLFRCLPHILLR